MKTKTRYCKICKEWFGASNAARHCQRKHPWLPVARVGRPGRPEHCHADCESQAPLKTMAAADGQFAVPEAGVTLSPLEVLAAVAVAAITDEQSVVQTSPTSASCVASALLEGPQGPAASTATEPARR